VTHLSLSQSVESVLPSEEEEEEQEGRQNYSRSGSTGSRLSGLINLKERRKRTKAKKLREKRGFIWHRWTPCEDLLPHRAPQLKLSRPLNTIHAPFMNLTTDTDENNSSSTIQGVEDLTPPLQSGEDLPSSIQDGQEPNEINSFPDILSCVNSDENINSISHQSSLTPSPSHLDLETTSTKSDISYQTASSDPQVDPLPVKVTDCYSMFAHAKKNGVVVNKKL